MPHIRNIIFFFTVIILFSFSATENNSRRSIVMNSFACLFAVFIGINGLIVAVVHIKWETSSSINLRNELQTIRGNKRPIEIDYGWFKRATEEKLKRWNIQYTPAQLGTDTAASKLTSVVKGYPNQVLYRLKHSGVF